MNGYWQERKDRTDYRVPILDATKLVEILGAVKLRSDGRWNWWRWKSRFHKWSTGQGVEENKEAAMKCVLEGSL